MNPSGNKEDQRLRAAVESSPSGILMIDPGGRIVLVNREVERLFGYTREELIGKPVELLVPDTFKDEHPGFRKKFLADPKVRKMGIGRELYGKHKDGGPVPVEIGLTPVATPEGLFILSAIVDISARKKADNRFKAAVDASPSGMLMVNESGEIILVNQQITSIFGYEHNELLGKHMEMLIPERYRANHPTHRNQYFQKPEIRAMGAGRELYGLRKDGTEVAVEIGLNPIGTGDELLVLCSIVDISARKKAQHERLILEEQLRHSQKLEAVGSLAGGVAHEFNNILMGILGFADLALDSNDPTESKENVQEIYNAASRGKELVDRILMFARKQKAQRKPLDLDGVIQEALSLMRSTLPATVNIRLQQVEKLPRVVADSTSIHQIVVNLLTNAAYAIANEGEIDIVLEPFYVHDSFARENPQLREGNYVRLSVKDNGVGISKDTLGRLFEPFFTTKEKSGSGLGLPIVHNIIQLHEGAILVDSTPGEGACFSCYFPAYEDLETLPEALEEKTIVGHGEVIYYLDDEEFLTRMMKKRLENLGYQVMTGNSPDSALDYLCAAQNQIPDLIISDFSMPRMNGLQFAETLGQSKKGFKIILLTGFIDEIPMDQLKSAGVVSVIRKPPSIEDLSRAIREALAK